MAETRDREQEKPLIEVFKERLQGLQGALAAVDLDPERRLELERKLHLQPGGAGTKELDPSGIGPAGLSG